MIHPIDEPAICAETFTGSPPVRMAPPVRTKVPLFPGRLWGCFCAILNGQGWLPMAIP